MSKALNSKNAARDRARVVHKLGPDEAEFTERVRSRKVMRELRAFQQQIADIAKEIDPKDEDATAPPPERVTALYEELLDVQVRMVQLVLVGANDEPPTTELLEELDERDFLELVSLLFPTDDEEQPDPQVAAAS